MLRLRESYQDPRLAEGLLRDIRNAASRIDGEARIMEVCGTHTVALRRSGIHAMLPRNVRMVSGPGCPVCVTPTGYIDNALLLLERPGVTLVSFGDMLKVPGSRGQSLASGLGSRRVRIVYSPAELSQIARESPGQVVFLAIGFETTIPTIAAATLRSLELGIGNLRLYTAFKTVPAALRALLAAPERALDALLLPGHVSVIIGETPYGFLQEEGVAPAAITGFEPLDLLDGILSVLRQLARGERRVENLYTRAVRPQGNPKARGIADRLLEPCGALWRGLGNIPDSGLRLREEYRELDAELHFQLPALENREPPGCGCADVLQGRLLPEECGLFGRLCTPEHPVGPCMVSSEGSCAARFRYGGGPA
jgi:hydrogenase expression/formation protein HypD